MSDEFNEYDYQEPLEFGRGFYLACAIEVALVAIIGLIIWAVFAS